MASRLNYAAPITRRLLIDTGRRLRPGGLPATIAAPSQGKPLIIVTGAGRSGLEEDTTLATITFQCRSEGISALSLIVAVGGIPEDIVEVQTEDGTVTCHEGAEATATEEAAPTATPLPSLPATGGGGGSGDSGLSWLIGALAGAGFAILAGGTLRLRARRLSRRA